MQSPHPVVFYFFWVIYPAACSVLGKTQERIPRCLQQEGSFFQAVCAFVYSVLGKLARGTMLLAKSGTVPSFVVWVARCLQRSWGRSQEGISHYLQRGYFLEGLQPAFYGRAIRCKKVFTCPANISWHSVKYILQKNITLLIDFFLTIRNNKCKTKQAGAQVWKRG